ncbi:MAG: nucleotide sugar dehydrogenase [Firmicutes bacterium]|nr:nucleotide sugar dehydrogenase [Bacillota bacterium]
MSLYKKIVEKKEKIAVIGLGYVGLPIAVELAKKVDVIGFDTNEEKISLYKAGIDPTHEVGSESIKSCTVRFSYDETVLKNAKFFIVAVPTPINLDKTPDLAPVIKSSETVGRSLTKGAIVVFESTVYPGVTEGICMPILEKISGLKCGKDFWIGYSPERINPGDKINTLKTIVKIVAGVDEYSLDEISKVYELVVGAGIHRAQSIKVAEAAKVVENSQRDINIAFMNELAIVFDKMNINTSEVVAAMNTKWNALGFTPGLVGGHCIGVDPYYFVYEAERLGYHSQIILSGRKINDSMGSFIADAVIKKIVKAGLAPKTAKIAVLGLTFKENCPDIRNSKVVDVVKRLREYEIEPYLYDCMADGNEFAIQYGQKIASKITEKDFDCVIFAVAHTEYKTMDDRQLAALFKKNGTKIIIDVKSMFCEKKLSKAGFDYWSL